MFCLASQTYSQTDPFFAENTGTAFLFSCQSLDMKRNSILSDVLLRSLRIVLTVKNHANFSYVRCLLCT